jgi:23S rRNA (pseudouridine1915-N3)-methyltransferase
MHIKVILAAKLKDDNYETLISDYLKRISAVYSADFVEISDSTDNSEDMSQKCLTKIVKHSEGYYRVGLDLRGKSFSSEQFAEWLGKQIEISGKIAFIVGSANGLPNTLTEKTDALISLSKLTFAHKIATLVIFEQIYRAMTINMNHPYHR